METSFAPWEKPKETLAPWEQPKGQTPTTQFGPIANSIDPDTLATNKDWLTASRIHYKYETGEDFEGTDQELADYGLDQMGWFNYNLPTMGVDAARVTNAPEDYQKSFLYMMDTYDALQMSWGGTLRFAQGVLLDPTTYVGIGTLGLGTAAAQGTKVATKQGVKELLRQGIGAGIRTGVEGAIYAGTGSALKQQVEVAGGRRDSISAVDVAVDAGIGAAAGFGLGTVVSAVGAKATQKGAGAVTPSTAPSPTAAVDNASMAAPTSPTAVPTAPNVLLSNVTQVAPSAAPTVEPTLPSNLAGAKPRYNFGQRGFGLEFESDVERALFITSQSKKSKSDGEYRAWLNSLGYTDDEIDALGRTVRDTIKAQAKDSSEDVLTIGRIADRKPSAAPAPSVAPPSTAPTPRDVSGMTPPSAPGTARFEDVIAAIKKVAPDMTEGNIPRTKKVLGETVKEVVETLKNMGIRTADEALDMFPKMGMTTDQQTTMKVSVNKAATELAVVRNQLMDVVKNPASSAKDVAEAQDALRSIGPMQDLMATIDKKVSSPSGYDLGSRVGSFNVNANRGLSPEAILRKQGIEPSLATPEQTQAAEREFQQRVADWIDGVAANKEVVDLTNKAKDLLAQGNITDALKALSDRDLALATKAKAAAKNSTALGRVYDAVNNSFIMKLNEYIISTVFDFATVAVNTIPAAIKTVYKPALNMVVKGAGSAARKEMMHTYSAMMSQVGAAFKAARVAFDLERSLLTGDADKFLNAGPAIKGRKGELLRIFPRALNATDEFFARINYQGYVAGEAAAQATEDAIQRGLSGKALDDFVKDAVSKKLSNAYELAPDKVKLLDSLRQKGANRGLKGQKLEIWIKSQMDKNEDLFRQATNESGRDYVDDLLFKREFSGDNAASKLAKGYERFVNANPIMRLAGQLFFRTPVRVFQEGVRLTPGFQIIDPTFIRDLTGSQGLAKQVKAQGELMLSYGIAAMAFAMYGTGMVTGGGPSDYRQRRALEDGKDWEAYTIRFSDESTFSFRNLDPFATPLKIMVNVMERMSDLEYRKSQGENIDGLAGEAFQYSSVAFGSLVQAVRDASLTAGFDQILDAWDALTVEEDTTKLKQLEKLIGKKVQLLVPAVVSGPQTIMDNRMSDPATLEQFVLARLNPSSNVVPKMYDALGRPRTINNPISSFIGPTFTTKEMREGDITEKEQVVLNGLADLQVATNSTFIFPYKMPGLDFDMRRRMTMDGAETIYDRVQREYRNLHIENALYPWFANGGIMTDGTKNTDGIRATEVRKIINDARETAFAIVMAKELGLTQEAIKAELRKSQIQMGAYAQQSNPYRR